VSPASPGNQSGHVRTFSGITLSVASDGTVEMSEEEAKPLIARGWKKIANRYVNDGDA
jgi:hypothetical protein